MKIVRYELAFAEGAIASTSPEDLVDAIILPDRLIGQRVPLEDAEGGSTRCDAQACLALVERGFRKLALRDIEIHAEDAVCPDVCIGAEPAHRAVWHG